MDNLNQMELQDIRHTYGAAEGFVAKLNYYTTITNDKTAVDIMNDISNCCSNLKDDLKSSLN